MAAYLAASATDEPPPEDAARWDAELWDAACEDLAGPRNPPG